VKSTKIDGETNQKSLNYSMLKYHRFGCLLIKLKSRSFIKILRTFVTAVTAGSCQFGFNLFKGGKFVLSLFKTNL